MRTIHIIPATTRAHFQQARDLIRAYVDWLDEDITHQNLEREYEVLETIYAPPTGKLLLAMLGQTAVGCVGLKPLEEAGTGSCEMKRLYVLDAYKGKGSGARLVDAIRLVRLGAGGGKI